MASPDLYVLTHNCSPRSQPVGQGLTAESGSSIKPVKTVPQFSRDAGAAGFIKPVGAVSVGAGVDSAEAGWSGGADGAGDMSLTFNAGAPVCGAAYIAIDLASCRVTSVANLP